MLTVMAGDGRRGREASPRGGRGAARARHEVRHADAQRPTACRSTSTSSTRSPTPTARRPPSCRSRSSATTARACTSTSRSGRAASRSSPATKYADLSDECLFYIGGILKHAKAINAFTNPLDQLLQASGPGLRGAGAARLLGAQPLGLVPHSARYVAQGQARRGPFPRSGARTPISASRRC